VQHPAGALTLKLTVDGLPWDARIQPDGNFTTATQTIARGRITTTTSITGRFTEAGFAARVNIKAVEPATQVRPGEPNSRTCDYKLRWQAEKL
jgi:hypothetical protein